MLPDCLSLSGARVLWISIVIPSFSLTKPQQQKWWDTITPNFFKKPQSKFHIHLIWRSLLIIFAFFLRWQDLSARDIESKFSFSNLICLPSSAKKEKTMRLIVTRAFSLIELCAKCSSQWKGFLTYIRETEACPSMVIIIGAENSSVCL